MNASIVQYFGKQLGKCGYCTGTNCSKSHGMHAYAMSSADYQDLIDRGWRRCGNYCYKPENNITCCPSYTIKCDALEFKLSKSNKRVLRRMNRFLRDGKRETNEQQSGNRTDPKNTDEGDVLVSEQLPKIPDKLPTAIDVEKISLLTKTQQQPKETNVAVEEAIEAALSEHPASISVSERSLSTYPPRKKAKQMRLERRQAKLETKAAGLVTEQRPAWVPVGTQEKTLNDFLNAEKDAANKHKLRIVLVAASDTQRTCCDAVHALYCKYQKTIHNDNPARLTPASMQRFLVKSALQLRLVHVHSEEFKLTLPQSLALYRKYQISVHKDVPKNRQAFIEHLQASPMKQEKPSNGPSMGFGTFHQQYWLDDKLIAVGVIDILPNSVSSVYFFYHPNYSFLSLGTYGSLREIELVQTIASYFPALKYYYMGFYIHSCPKMRYKGKLSASYLLCPETYCWEPLTDIIRAKLDDNKYQRLNTNDEARDANEFLPQHLNDVKMLIDSHKRVSYRQLSQITIITQETRDSIMEYGKLVGKNCALRMIYVNI